MYCNCLVSYNVPSFFLFFSATIHLKYLETTQQQLQTRLIQAEMDTQRLRLYVTPFAMSHVRTLTSLHHILTGP